MEDKDLRLWKSKMAVGRMSYDLGLYPQAVHHFRTALSLFEAKHIPQELLSRNLVDLAKALGSMGHFDEGEELLNKAIRLDTEDCVSSAEIIEDYHQLSLLFWRANKQGAAEDAIAQAMKLMSESKESIPDELIAKLKKHKAVLSVLNKDYRNAEKLIDDAILFIASSPVMGKFSPLYGDCLMVKLMMYMETERFEEALALYPEALKILDVSRGETHVKTIAFIEAIEHLSEEKGLHEEAATLKKELARLKEMSRKKGVD
ncbi:MAG: hypothetical protein K2X27_24875 [Candidatus Obscuribacterales bacterium]|nr:hypothetical protein [Candidatus Obscuribacterales bacterium]